MISLAFSFLFLQGDGIPNIPSRHPKAEFRAFTEGPAPGSRAPESKPTATFIRAEYVPPGIRLLVRSNCSVDVSQADLLRRAEQTKENSMTKMDWGRINENKDISLYAVVYYRKRITTFHLKAEKGVYQVASTDKKEQPYWEVLKITPVGKGSCFKVSEVDKDALKAGVLNELGRIGGNQVKERENDLRL